MVNFRVRDLDRMAVQLRSAGIEVKIEPQSYPNGRFARLHDPEGNPIELWQPAMPSASPSFQRLQQCCLSWQAAKTSELQDCFGKGTTPVVP